MTAQDAQPTYYVRHPDGSYSVADPQPRPVKIISSACNEVGCAVLARERIALKKLSDISGEIGQEL